MDYVHKLAGAGNQAPFSGVYFNVLPGFVLRAATRQAAIVHASLARRVNGLASVACLAPWLGILGTCEMIVTSFRGCGCSQSSGLGALSGNLSDALHPAVIGLGIGLLAAWQRRYLTTRLEAFDSEMRCAALDLVNTLLRLPRAEPRA